MTTQMLELDHVTLGYAHTEVVREVSLSLAKGEIGCLLGPSGCGKTTLLRAIGGFEPLRAGRIALAGRAVATAKAQLPPRERGIGMVFQDHALFPHLNVQDNVAFGLSRLSAAERQRRVNEMLNLVGLNGLQQRWPHELSGGQQQRIALARALAPQPALLLMDEPFSNLDTRLRVSIAREIRTILLHAGATALMVTHDQNEAFAMADVVGVMANDRLHQWATAPEVYHQPATLAVATLIGEGVLLPVQTNTGGLRTTVIGPVAVDAPCFEVDGITRVLVRPENLAIKTEGTARGQVTERVFRGSHFLYTVQIGDTPILVQGAIDQPHEIGDTVGISSLHCK